MLKVIYSRQMRGLINNGSLLLAPLCLPVITCTLAACVHCLLIYCCLTCREGRRRREAAASFNWTTRVSSSQQQQQRRWDPLWASAPKDGTQRCTMPLRTARNCRAEWMAAFTAINSLLPNYLIHHMHTPDSSAHMHTLPPPLLPPLVRPSK